MDAKMEKNKKITDTNDINTVYENSIQNPDIIVEKKKRGRKKNIKLEVSLPTANLDTTEPVVEKKIRKRRSKKSMAQAHALAAANTAGEINGIENTNLNTEVATVVKVRKRRVCKSKNNVNADTNIIIDLNNPDSQINIQPPEEKVVKKRGRKPKGGKIITQKLEENNNNNEMPNIILHLKCSLNDIKNTSSVKLNGEVVEKNEIQSYNNLSQLKGSEIYTKNTGCNNATPIPVYSDSSSHLFKVYDPVVSCIDNTSTSSGSGPGMTIFNTNTNTNTNTNDNRDEPVYKSNEILNNKSGLFNSSVYSPDINLYDNEYDDGDDVDSVKGSCKNEKEIWRKINQLKVSFHKSDICKNTGGTQRSACFWCTCEFDSPAVYIPKTLSKDVYNVYGCFCSPECSAAFLMNENIDTSTKFERYHLLNSLYGKIYKYEKSIKIAPNPFYLLNKFYGNLTIQEYRKLFQSEQMIYVVNKPLTHILPELYEDNNDFLLNNKIIPTNSVNIKKNKPLKSNIINNAFGITVGGN